MKKDCMREKKEHIPINEDECVVEDSFLKTKNKKIGDYIDLFDGEKSVTEISEDLDMNQSAISHQLKILKVSKLVRSRRSGKTILYDLDDEHVKTIIATGKEHIEEK